MATPATVGLLPPAESHTPGRRLGLLNGLLIGLALAAGAWAVAVIRLAAVPGLLAAPSLLLATATIASVCASAGWLTARWQKSGLTLIVWLLAAALASLLIGQETSLGRNLVVWLADRRFWGLPIYPARTGLISGALIAGVFIYLVLGALALLQESRLETVQSERGDNGRLGRRAWFFLALPLPLVALAGLVTTQIMADQAAPALQMVQRTIQGARGYEGDLNELGQRDGLNYGALERVRDRLDGDYTLMLGSQDPAALVAFVVVHFESGEWLACRLLNGQLSFCFDASLPYTQGLSLLVSGAEPPAECPACLPRTSGQWPRWLQDWGQQFEGEPAISREAQWGSYVLMRLESPDGRLAAECLFAGISPVTLLSCEESRKD